MTDPNLFATSATVPTLFWAFAKVPALAGDKKLGLLYCSEVAACSEVVPAITADGKQLGDTVAYSAGYSGSSPIYTAVCLAAKQAGVNAIEPIGPVVTANLRLLDNCAAQDYHPLPITSGASVGSALLHDANIPEFWGFVDSVPYFAHNSATKIFDKVMGSYMPHALVPQNVALDWTGLQAFAAAAAKIPASATPTAQDIYNGLYSFNGTTLGGFSVPLTFHKGVGNPVTCVFIIDGKNGRFGLPDGTKPQCESKS